MILRISEIDTNLQNASFWQRIEGEDSWRTFSIGDDCSVPNYSTHLFLDLGIGDSALEWILHSVEIEFESQGIDADAIMSMF